MIDKYKAFLFDWDGTVSRTLETWLQIIRESLESFGLKDLSDSEIAKTFGQMERETLALGLSAKDFPAFESLIKQKAITAVPAAEFYDGISDILEHVKNSGKHTGVITANHRITVDQILSAKGKTDYFDIVVAGDEVNQHKPDPEGILRAIKKFGVDKNQVVFLGDSKHDIGAAKNAGIDSVLFYPASHEIFHDFEDIKTLEPTYIIDDWSKLFSL